MGGTLKIQKVTPSPTPFPLSKHTPPKSNLENNCPNSNKIQTPHSKICVQLMSSESIVK
jgi:hypothetical protein